MKKLFTLLFTAVSLLAYSQFPTNVINDYFLENTHISAGDSATIRTALIAAFASDYKTDVDTGYYYDTFGGETDSDWFMVLLKDGNVTNAAQYQYFIGGLRWDIDGEVTKSLSMPSTSDTGNEQVIIVSSEHADGLKNWGQILFVNAGIRCIGTFEDTDAYRLRIYNNQLDFTLSEYEVPENCAFEAYSNDFQGSLNDVDFSGMTRIMIGGNTDLTSTQFTPTFNNALTEIHFYNLPNIDVDVDSWTYPTTCTNINYGLSGAYASDLFDLLDNVSEDIYFLSISNTGTSGTLSSTNQINLDELAYLYLNDNSGIDGASYYIKPSVDLRYYYFYNTNISEIDAFVDTLFAMRDDFTYSGSKQVKFYNIDGVVDGASSQGDLGTYTGSFHDLTEAQIDNLCNGDDYDGNGTNYPWTPGNMLYALQNMQTSSTNSTPRYNFSITITSCTVCGVAYFFGLDDYVHSDTLPIIDGDETVTFTTRINTDYQTSGSYVKYILSAKDVDAASKVEIFLYTGSTNRYVGIQTRNDYKIYYTDSMSVSLDGSEVDWEIVCNNDTITSLKLDNTTITPNINYSGTYNWNDSQFVLMGAFNSQGESFGCTKGFIYNFNFNNEVEWAGYPKGNTDTAWVDINSSGADVDGAVYGSLETRSF